MNKQQFRGMTLVAVAAVVMAAAAGGAQASIIRFDNPPGPGHFEWEPPAGGQNVLLNITHAHNDQGQPLATPGSFRQVWSGVSNISVGGSSSTLNRIQAWLVPSGTFSMVSSADFGTLLPLPTPNVFGVSGFVHRDSTPAGDPEWAFDEGVEKYLSVKFDLGGGDQFGWIGVVRTGNLLDAFAWGYETTPGVPIAAGAPEPGSLALLAFGAVGAMTRRGRSRA